MQEKRYEEAIEVLIGYVRTHPDNFDKVQKRLQRIIEIQKKFNIAADELLDTVEHNPDDTERILSLISQMEILKSSRSVQVQDFIAQTQTLTQFSHNRNRLRRVLEEGRDLTAAGDYQGALRAYARGLDIYQDDFFDSEYGEIIEDRIRQVVADINGGVESFSAITGPLNAAAAEIAQAARQTGPDSSGGVSRIGGLFERFTAAAGPVRELQNLLYENAVYFDEQLNYFQRADRTIGDGSFLSFASRLIQGSDEFPKEGMLGVVEAYWDAVAGGVERSLAALADQSFTAALADMKTGDYERARRRFDYAAAYTQYPLALLDAGRELRKTGGGPDRVLFDQQVLAGKEENFLSFRSLIRAVDYLAEAAALDTAFERALETKPLFDAWQQGSQSAGEAMLQENQIRQETGRLLAETRALLAEAAAEMAELGNLRAPEGEDSEERFPEYIENANSVLSELWDRIFAHDYESAVRFYTMAREEMSRRLSGRRAAYEEGDRLIQGITRTDENGVTEIDHYPAEGLAVLSSLEREVTADTQWGDSVFGQYTAEAPELRAAGEIPGLGASIQTL
ncbi:MAG: hypothetical protein LBH26_07130, partial [Treponema sp.]|nr:hypothetical protein [Treponema sp.]